MSDIIYHISPVKPSAHIFAIEVVLENPNPEQKFSLPVWIPGSYMIREFPKDIINVKAEDDSGQIEIIKEKKNTWVAANKKGCLRVTYEVYAWDLSVRMSHLDQTHGYFNGTSVFLMAHGYENSPHVVHIHPPVDTKCKDWQVATTLTRISGDQYGFGSFSADDYDELIDHPVEMGTFEKYEFSAQGIPHSLVITGQHTGDTERIVADLTVICDYFLRMFGAPHPMDRYLFMLMIVGKGYGGLEHRASTSLISSRNDLPKKGDESMSKDYLKFLGLCSHEYFHTWNVKKIKPKAYLPYDLNQEAYTRQLWIFEGGTSYFDDLCLVHTRLITIDTYLELLGKLLTRVRMHTGRKKQTLAQSSFDAWVKLYRADENATNSQISYYSKGGLAALSLDLHLRLHSDITLKDIFVRLWKDYGRPLIGLPEGEFEKLAMEMSGLDLTAFFDHAIRTTDDLPVGQLLSHFGIKVCTRPRSKNNDVGGTPDPNADQLRMTGNLGVKYAPAEGGAKIAVVYDDSAAQLAGLSAKDVIIAVNGLRVSNGNIYNTIANFKAGEEIIIHAFRRDELMKFNVVLLPPKEDIYYLERMEDVPSSVTERMEKWLCVTTSEEG